MSILKLEKYIPERKRLVKLAKLANGKVLDIGFNDNPNPFLENPIGFDLEDFNVSKASNYVSFKKGNCEEVAKYFDDKEFDTVIAAEIIEHLENPSEFLRNVYKILKDDGLLLISTPNPYNISTLLANLIFSKKGLGSGHINLFPYRNMIELLSHCKFICINTLNAVGGTKFLPHPYNRIIFFPMIKGFCWQIIYVIKKNIKK